MKIDWFALGFSFLGLINVLSGCYEWTWWWRLARPGYLPTLIGWNNTRLLYIVGGTGCLGGGIALTLQSILSVNSVWFFLLGFVLATTVTVILYNARGDQSILELISPIDKGKSKRKNENNVDLEQ
jgi:hypothetical protein